MSCLKPVSNSGLEQQASAKMKPPLLDVLAQVLLGQGIELGGLVAVEEDDGCLEEVGDGGGGGIDDLPGEQVFPVAGDDRDEVADVVGIVFPSHSAGRGGAC